MAQGDTFEVKLVGTVLGQQVITVFHYTQSETGVAHPDLEDCEAQWQGTVGGGMIALMNHNVNYSVARMSWVIGGTEVQDIPLEDFDGVRSGDCLPPAVCWSYLMRRQANTTFNGHKRFPGVSEPDQVDGVPASGILSAISALADDLGASLTIDGVVYLPSIVSRYLNGVARTTPYVNFVDSAQFTSIGTQNTRKFGRGA